MSDGTTRKAKSTVGVLRRLAKPFLFLTLVLGMVAGTELSGAIATEFLSGQEAELGRLLNAERAARGLPVLPNSDALRTIARRHSQAMMIEGRIFHNERIAQDVEAVFPAWKSVGENVGTGPSIPSVHQAFMDSPGHRANILDPDWGWLGIGVVSSGNKLFMTENFLTLQAGAPRPVPAEFRLSGSGRTATAQAIANFGFSPGSAGGAVLADAGDFHGALAGSSLAGKIGGPSLISSVDNLDVAARDALVRALGAGSGKTVYLVGGPFSQAVRDAITGLGFTPVAVGGADHVAMAADVARQLAGRPGGVFISTVANYPDALAASAIAAAKRWPVLYTDTGTLSAATKQYLTDLGVTKTYVVGGPNAVSDAVVNELAGLGTNPQRISGSSRVETSVAIADFALTVGLQTRHVQVATAYNFPDALAGGALAGVLGSPVILTTTEGLHPAAAAWFSAHRTAVDGIYLLGGPNAVSTAVGDQIKNALAG